MVDAVEIFKLKQEINMYDKIQIIGILYMVSAVFCGILTTISMTLWVGYAKRYYPELAFSAQSGLWWRIRYLKYLFRKENLDKRYIALQRRAQICVVIYIAHIVFLLVLPFIILTVYLFGD